MPPPLLISWETYFLEAATGDASWEKKILAKILQYSQESYRPVTLLQVFFSEYCEIFKNTYFEEHLLTAASVF